MEYLVASTDVTIGVLIYIAVLRGYGRRFEGLSGPWILENGHRND